MLRQVAQRLRESSHESDTVARWGGDEFAFLVISAEDASDVMEVAQRIQDTLRAPFNVVEQDVFITSSVGISLYPLDGESSVELLRNAGAALYRAKDLGDSKYQFYTTDIRRPGHQET
ncbi:MAG: GGDEF domain-containing protein [Pyrinomonadaceae bacterium]